MKNNDQAFLGQEKLGRLMGKYSVPCVISLLVAALYNIVDQIFIANAAYLGSDGNAANTVVFPLTVIALAIAVMIGDGCCAFVSISLGADRREDAHRGVGNAVVLSAAGGIVLCILYLIFRMNLSPCSAARSTKKHSRSRKNISSGYPWAYPSMFSARR